VGGGGAAPTVALVTDCWTPTANGVVTAIRLLRDGLEEAGHRVLVLAPAGRDDGNVAGFRSIPVRRAIDLQLTLPAPGAVERLLRREHVDVVHTHTEFTLGWTARRAARRLGLPLVHTAHTLYEAHLHYAPVPVPPAAVTPFLARFLSAHHLIGCPSPKAARYVAAALPGAPTVLVPNGVDVERFRPDPARRETGRRLLGVPPDASVILSVGRLGPEKRVRQLLGAALPLLRTSPRAHLVLVGRGPEASRLRAEAGRLGVGRQVILPGGIPWEAMPSLYAAADLYATASLTEMQPMTVLEAAAAGLPVVARSDAAFDGLVRDGESGRLAGSDGALAAALAAVAADGELRRRLAAGASRTAPAFSVAAHAARWKALYPTMTEPPGARPDLPSRATLS
jgi:1,2-diacylglycerol 3-alpha-glucosyltransferase